MLTEERRQAYLATAQSWDWIAKQAESTGACFSCALLRERADGYRRLADPETSDEDFGNLLALFQLTTGITAAIVRREMSRARARARQN